MPVASDLLTIGTPGTTLLLGARASNTGDIKLSLLTSRDDETFALVSSGDLLCDASSTVLACKGAVLNGDSYALTAILENGSVYRYSAALTALPPEPTSSLDQVMAVERFNPTMPGRQNSAERFKTACLVDVPAGCPLAGLALRVTAGGTTVNVTEVPSLRGEGTGELQASVTVAKVQTACIDVDLMSDTHHATPAAVVPAPRPAPAPAPVAHQSAAQQSEPSIAGRMWTSLFGTQPTALPAPTAAVAPGTRTAAPEARTAPKPDVPGEAEVVAIAGHACMSSHSARGRGTLSVHILALSASGRLRCVLLQLPVLGGSVSWRGATVHHSWTKQLSVLLPGAQAPAAACMLARGSLSLLPLPRTLSPDRGDGCSDALLLVTSVTEPAGRASLAAEPVRSSLALSLSFSSARSDILSATRMLPASPVVGSGGGGGGGASYESQLPLPIPLRTWDPQVLLLDAAVLHGSVRAAGGGARRFTVNALWGAPDGPNSSGVVLSHRFEIAAPLEHSHALAGAALSLLRVTPTALKGNGATSGQTAFRHHLPAVSAIPLPLLHPSAQRALMPAGSAVGGGAGLLSPGGAATAPLLSGTARKRQQQQRSRPGDTARGVMRSPAVQRALSSRKPAVAGASTNVAPSTPSPSSALAHSSGGAGEPVSGRKRSRPEDDEADEDGSGAAADAAAVGSDSALPGLMHGSEADWDYDAPYVPAGDGIAHAFRAHYLPVLLGPSAAGAVARGDLGGPAGASASLLPIATPTSGAGTGMSSPRSGSDAGSGDGEGVDGEEGPWEVALLRGCRAFPAAVQRLMSSEEPSAQTTTALQLLAKNRPTSSAAPRGALTPGGVLSSTLGSLALDDFDGGDGDSDGMPLVNRALRAVSYASAVPASALLDCAHAEVLLDTHSTDATGRDPAAARSALRTALVPVLCDAAETAAGWIADAMRARALQAADSITPGRSQGTPLTSADEWRLTLRAYACAWSLLRSCVFDTLQAPHWLLGLAHSSTSDSDEDLSGESAHHGVVVLTASGQAWVTPVASFEDLGEAYVPLIVSSASEPAESLHSRLTVAALEALSAGGSAAAPHASPPGAAPLPWPLASLLADAAGWAPTGQSGTGASVYPPLSLAPDSTPVPAAAWAHVWASPQLVKACAASISVAPTTPGHAPLQWVASTLLSLLPPPAVAALEASYEGGAAAKTPEELLQWVAQHYTQLLTSSVTAATTAAATSPSKATSAIAAVARAGILAPTGGAPSLEQLLNPQSVSVAGVSHLHMHRRGAASSAAASSSQQGMPAGLQAGLRVLQSLLSQAALPAGKGASSARVSEPAPPAALRLLDPSVLAEVAAAATHRSSPLDIGTRGVQASTACQPLLHVLGPLSGPFLTFILACVCVATQPYVSTVVASPPIGVGAGAPSLAAATPAEAIAYALSSLPAGSDSNEAPVRGAIGRALCTLIAPSLASRSPVSALDAVPSATFIREAHARHLLGWLQQQATAGVPVVGLIPAAESDIEPSDGPSALAHELLGVQSLRGLPADTRPGSVDDVPLAMALEAVLGGPDALAPTIDRALDALQGSGYSFTQSIAYAESVVSAAFEALNEGDEGGNVEDATSAALEAIASAGASLQPMLDSHLDEVLTGLLRLREWRLAGLWARLMAGHCAGRSVIWAYLHVEGVCYLSEAALGIAEISAGQNVTSSSSDAAGSHGSFALMSQLSAALEPAAALLQRPRPVSVPGSDGLASWPALPAVLAARRKLDSLRSAADRFDGPPLAGLVTTAAHAQSALECFSRAASALSSDARSGPLQLTYSLGLVHLLRASGLPHGTLLPWCLRACALASSVPALAPLLPELADHAFDVAVPAATAPGHHDDSEQGQRSRSLGATLASVLGAALPSYEGALEAVRAQSVPNRRAAATQELVQRLVDGRQFPLLADLATSQAEGSDELASFVAESLSQRAAGQPTAPLSLRAARMLGLVPPVHTSAAASGTRGAAPSGDDDVPCGVPFALALQALLALRGDHAAAATTAATTAIRLWRAFAAACSARQSGDPGSEDSEGDDVAAGFRLFSPEAAQRLLDAMQMPSDAALGLAGGGSAPHVPPPFLLAGVRAVAHCLQSAAQALGALESASASSGIRGAGVALLLPPAPAPSGSYLFPDDVAAGIPSVATAAQVRLAAGCATALVTLLEAGVLTSAHSLLQTAEAPVNGGSGAGSEVSCLLPSCMDPSALVQLLASCGRYSQAMALARAMRAARVTQDGRPLLGQPLSASPEAHTVRALAGAAAAATAAVAAAGGQAAGEGADPAVAAAAAREVFLADVPVTWRLDDSDHRHHIEDRCWALLQGLVQPGAHNAAPADPAWGAALLQAAVAGALAADPSAALPAWLTGPLGDSDPGSLARLYLGAGRPVDAARLLAARLPDPEVGSTGGAASIDTEAGGEQHPHTASDVALRELDAHPDLPGAPEAAAKLRARLAFHMGVRVPTAEAIVAAESRAVNAARWSSAATGRA